jgi:hypothetical protein
MIKPKQIEEPFGRSESVGSFRKTRHRGRDLVEWFFILSVIPYDLIGITTILAARGCCRPERGKAPC